MDIKKLKIEREMFHNLATPAEVKLLRRADLTTTYQMLRHPEETRNVHEPTRIRNGDK
jgi:hypothetical protein